MRCLVPLLMASLVAGCMGKDDALTQEDTPERALVEMLKAERTKAELSPAGAESALRVLKTHGAKAGSLKPDRLSGEVPLRPEDCWTIDIGARRFQYWGGLNAFTGEFHRRADRWEAEVTGQWAIEVGSGP